MAKKHRVRRTTDPIPAFNKAYQASRKKVQKHTDIGAGIGAGLGAIGLGLASKRLNVSRLGAIGAGALGGAGIGGGIGSTIGYHKQQKELAPKEEEVKKYAKKRNLLISIRPGYGISSTVKGPKRYKAY